jgi:hypothetical protein
MALTVTLNQRISSKILGTINQNYGFYDPLTGVNLNKGNPTSADLSGFSQAQLVNICNAVYMGTLSVSSGAASALGVHTAAFSTYSLYATAGDIGQSVVYEYDGITTTTLSKGGSANELIQPFGSGISGVAADSKYEDNS